MAVRRPRVRCGDTTGFIWVLDEDRRNCGGRVNPRRSVALVDGGGETREASNDRPRCAGVRLTKAFAILAAALALNACGTRMSADDYGACEQLIYRTPAPEREARLSCAHRLDVWQ